ncbi:CAP domain-containing protein [Pararhodobacter sp.]|uniref:CAP domain-containing protein n=1 Tax=Pararhodobacter sp. TaxID=2127056 RepID=UPI002FE2099E|nr:CAP domain-containing protein [Pseudomonadota bacterium]
MMLRLALLLALLSGPALACTLPEGLAALRVELLNLANAERAAQGVATLSPDPRLDEAAQTQACRMADRERLSHRGSWFAGLGRRLRRVDYPYAMAVENIGEGQISAPQIIQGWMDSPGHRQNMLARDAREAGFGVARAENGRLHWSMVAAAPRF